jgi:hypothetical protein
VGFLLWIPARTRTTPGPGLRPVALAGRAGDIDSFEVLADRAAHGLVSRSIIFAGLRGVGKTVLLGELALERGCSWLGRASAKVTGALGSIVSLQAKVGVDGVSLGVERLPGRADSGRIQFDLVDLAETVGAAAREDTIGALILIDEMQDLIEEQISAVCRSRHRAGQLNLPWFVIGGGLPNLPAKLAETESYAERLFEYRTIDRLKRSDAVYALTAPAQERHVSWDAAAIEFVLDESGGYPYFLQQFGETVWDAAAGPDSITLTDATYGIAEGQQQLEIGFYASAGSARRKRNGTSCERWPPTTAKRPGSARSPNGSTRGAQRPWTRSRQPHQQGDRLLPGAWTHRLLSPWDGRLRSPQRRRTLTRPRPRVRLPARPKTRSRLPSRPTLWHARHVADEPGTHTPLRVAWPASRSPHVVGRLPWGSRTHRLVGSR